MSVRYVYKLVLPGGEGRRVSLDAEPTWDVLASRVHELFSIPVNDVGLVYIDDDGDEITISSEFELQDYHEFLNRRSSHAPTPLPRKFIVRNLAVSGARRPASDSSSFSFVKHSPVERNSSVSPNGLPKPRSLSSPQPSHERGRSPSPVLLSESRIIAQEESGDLVSFVDGPNEAGTPSDNGSEIEAHSFLVNPPPRLRSLSTQRSRSLSPSFIRMARSPPSEAPDYEFFRRTPVLPEIPRDYPPTPPLHHSHPASRSPSPYYPLRRSRPTSPPIIMGGIRGPIATASSPVQYITTEDIMRFINDRPIDNLSQRSLSSPAVPVSSGPASAVDADRVRSRETSVGSSGSQRVVFSVCAHSPPPHVQSSRPPSVIYVQRPPSRANTEDIGHAPPSTYEDPLPPAQPVPSPPEHEKALVGLIGFIAGLFARLQGLLLLGSQDRALRDGEIPLSRMCSFSFFLSRFLNSRTHTHSVVRLHLCLFIAFDLLQMPQILRRLFRGFPPSPDLHYVAGESHVVGVGHRLRM